MSTPHLSDQDVRTDLSTRQTRLKWVIVVDEGLPAGRVVNAAACMAAAVGKALPDLLGRAGEDADGVRHPGLPWTGCSVLAADAATVRAVRAKAAGYDELLIVDMPEPAQTARVYDAYLAELAGTAAGDLAYCAVSLVGPRNRINRLVGGLGLLR
ncbi:hypothetical protein GCM10018793_08220 [Streptomyces sulfonofaciens]|uniref:DUF2000 domain-containing protein n=1 Tax=Streptomyces sulfonofaciens TaxID=68272 RepID=A0A919KTL4_9ACTN|nr:DUF2000 domain-containing protein [Streptomyces sulfonofaciens]GHH71967.1 hypothetical protein GCM10018793_08220 [Streptomyces sulfonofaciens]